MRIQHISSGSQDCPLIRIYGTDISSLRPLKKAFDQLAEGSAHEIAIDALASFESIDGVHLKAKADQLNQGVVRSGDNSFVVALKKPCWAELATLVNALIAEGRGYQWLDESSEVSLLLTLSDDGWW